MVANSEHVFRLPFIDESKAHLWTRRTEKPGGKFFIKQDDASKTRKIALSEMISKVGMKSRCINLFVFALWFQRIQSFPYIFHEHTASHVRYFPFQLARTLFMFL